MRRSVPVAVLLVLSLFGTTARALPSVDVAIVFAVDSSVSIDTPEWELQRQGYVDAILDPTIVPHDGTVALEMITYGAPVYPGVANITIAWTVIDSLAAATAFVNAIPLTSPIGGGTPIYKAIDVAVSSLSSAAFLALPTDEHTRLILDVSGDGKDNLLFVPGVEASRDAALSFFDMINGLPIENVDAPDLGLYYADHVIGGAGAFTVIADDFSDFGRAIKLKIGREVRPAPEPATTVLFGLGLTLVIGCRLRRQLDPSGRSIDS